MAGSIVLQGNLTVDMPVKVLKVTELRTEESFNNHARAYFTGIIDEKDRMKAIYDLNIQTHVKIKAVTEEGDKIIFSGLPVSVNLEHVRNVYYVHIVLSSYSILSDFELKSRSFQNIQNQYKNIFSEIVKEYNGVLSDTATKGANQKAPIIQYEETDWEFMKRIASQLGHKIYTDAKNNVPVIRIGIDAGNSFEEEGYNYIIEKSIKDYFEWQGNYNDCTEQDFITYCIESTNNYELGDRVSYKGVSFVVVEKISQLSRGILVYTYRLQREDGIKQSTIYNPKFAGLSIEGKVLAVEKDKLKLHLSIDSEQKVDEAYWYTFDTSYSAEGSTGWYCMPQAGDSVLLYIPGKDERLAFVKRVNRFDGLENPKVQDPKIKYFGTVDGKQMKLAPKELSFDAVEGSLFIKMSDQAGVEITGNSDINLKTKGFMYGECEIMNMESKDKIILSTGKANIIVDKIVHIKG